MLIYDPLEQFLLECTYCYHIKQTSSNSSFIKSIIIISFINWFFFNIRKPFLNLTKEKIIIFFFEFISYLIGNALKTVQSSFTLIFQFLFIIIFSFNLIGMIPYSITLTSHLIITLFFSLAFFIGANIIALCFHKIKYFVLFLPQGVPTLIIPFIILLEYVSYISRIFSLSIRLFANMMSGHILLKIVISFIWTILTLHFITIFWLFLPMILVLIILNLEFVISFLQAYIFVVLLSIYLNDALNTH